MCAPSHDVSGIGQSVQAASVVRQCSGCQGLRGTGAGGMEDRGTGVGDMRDGGHWGGARGRRGVPPLTGLTGHTSPSSSSETSKAAILEK